MCWGQNKTTNQLMGKIIDRLIYNESNHELQLHSVVKCIPPNHHPVIPPHCLSASLLLRGLLGTFFLLICIKTTTHQPGIGFFFMGA